MTTTETREVGTIWTAESGDDLSGIDPGPEARLCSTHRYARGVYLGRAWYVRGDRGMLSFEETGDAGLKLCERFLRDAGYRPADDHGELYTRSA